MHPNAEILLTRQVACLALCHSATELACQKFWTQCVNKPLTLVRFADFTQTLILENDVSGQGQVAVLWNKKRLIECEQTAKKWSEKWKKKLEKHEIGAVSTEMSHSIEVLGYLLGSKFTVIMDNNLQCHLKSAELGATEQRWVAQWAAFDLNLQLQMLSHDTL